MNVCKTPTQCISFILQSCFEIQLGGMQLLCITFSLAELWNIWRNPALSEKCSDTAKLHIIAESMCQNGDVVARHQAQLRMYEPWA